jgi:hypothetical protein
VNGRRVNYYKTVLEVFFDACDIMADEPKANEEEEWVFGDILDRMKAIWSLGRAMMPGSFGYSESKDEEMLSTLVQKQLVECLDPKNLQLLGSAKERKRWILARLFEFFHVMTLRQL